MDVERPAMHVKAMWGFCLGGDEGHKLMSISLKETILSYSCLMFTIVAESASVRISVN